MTRQKNLTERTALRMPPALARRVDQKRRALGLTRSEAARAALVDWTQDAPPVIETEPPELTAAA